jgi:hypothetical protein
MFRLGSVTAKSKQHAVNAFDIVWCDDVEKTQAATTVPRHNADATLMLTLVGSKTIFRSDKQARRPMGRLNIG